MDKSKEKDDYGYHLFPEKNKEKKNFLIESLFTFNNKCRIMLKFATDTSEYSS